MGWVWLCVWAWPLPPYMYEEHLINPKVQFSIVLLQNRWFQSVVLLNNVVHQYMEIGVSCCSWHTLHQTDHIHYYTPFTCTFLHLIKWHFITLPGLNAVTKTAKFTIICKTIDKINEMYSRGCRESPSKITRIAKITKFTKTAKFTIIRRPNDKINKMYSTGSREGLSKVMRISKITKFTKTAKFTIIHRTNDKINEMYSKRSRGGPSKITRIAKITKFIKTGKFSF